jgi:hypothetical protein
VYSAVVVVGPKLLNEEAILMRRTIITLLVSCSFVCAAPGATFQQKTAKKQLEAAYVQSKPNKLQTVLVCLSDKLPAMAFPQTGRDLMLFESQEVRIEDGKIKETSGVAVSYLKKGELLRINRRKVGKDYVQFALETLSPHSVTRGVGAFQHESSESLYCVVRFAFSPAVLASADSAPIRAEIEKWFKSFADYDSAVAFGNTASGQFVPEIRIGMPLEEVEKILGPPLTKFTFPDKVVYRYKDFTVEFKNNIVTDIKF